jgi:hypothetical protein
LRDLTVVSPAIAGSHLWALVELSAANGDLADTRASIPVARFFDRIKLCNSCLSEATAFERLNRQLHHGITREYIAAFATDFSGTSSLLLILSTLLAGDHTSTD